MRALKKSLAFEFWTEKIAGVRTPAISTRSDLAIYEECVSQTSQIARSERVEIAGVQAPAIWDAQDSNASDVFRALTRKKSLFSDEILNPVERFPTYFPGSK